MKNINYKYVSLVLGFVLVVTYSWHWNDIVGHNTDNNMKMGSMMHKMPYGSMMNMSDMQSGSIQKDMSMGSMMMDMLANMKGKTGAELEKVFLQEMIVHHKGAVDMATELLKDKTIKPELAKFAQDIINAQTSEISIQKKWLKDWFGINK